MITEKLKNEITKYIIKFLWGFYVRLIFWGTYRFSFICKEWGIQKDLGDGIGSSTALKKHKVEED